MGEAGFQTIVSKPVSATLIGAAVCHLMNIIMVLLTVISVRRQVLSEGHANQHIPIGYMSKSPDSLSLQCERLVSRLSLTAHAMCMHQNGWTISIITA